MSSSKGDSPKRSFSRVSRSPDRGWGSLAADRPTARRVGNPGRGAGVERFLCKVAAAARRLTTVHPLIRRRR